ncbi:MAG: type II toxin-antitoxin system VapC family toxin [Candidatus Sulfotelmatobacter sp.]
MILLDTHVVIWIALNPAKISKNARNAMDKARQGDSGIAISDMTLLELARLSSMGQVRFNTRLEAFLSELERRFVVLPMNSRICVQAFELPASYPKDPADRIIGATALVEGLPLITADQAIRASRALTTIW